MQYTFLPIVTVTEREDGRLAVSFDWSDSQDETRDDSGNVIEGYNEEEQPGRLISEAMDKWIASHPSEYIIERVE